MAFPAPKITIFYHRKIEFTEKDLHRLSTGIFFHARSPLDFKSFCLVVLKTNTATFAAVFVCGKAERFRFKSFECNNLLRKL